MKIPANLYRRLQEELPELFIAQEQLNEPSTIFAEFLPETALANLNGNPWGQLCNREIPLKRKTLIIALYDIKDFNYSQLKDLYDIVNFLKRADFEVFITNDNALEKYSN